MNANLHVRVRSVWAAVVAGVFVGVGCVPPTVDLRPGPEFLPKTVPPAFDDTDWAAVLRKHVRGGLVDYDALARERAPLDRFVAMISVIGPTSTPNLFPSGAHRVAYDLNAYNALVFYAVLQDPNRATLYGLSQPDPLTAITFQLDRRPTTLRALETRLLDETKGDVRVLFALSQGARGAPAPYPDPFRAPLLDRQLGEAAAAALDNPYVLQIDNRQKCVFVWMTVLTYEEQFTKYWVARHRTPAVSLLGVLADLASLRRREALNGVATYTIRAMPFDRRLNKCADTAAVPGP